MAIEKEALLALKGNMIVGVKSKVVFNIRGLVTIKNVVASQTNDEAYDMNNDGVVDEEDVRIYRKILLGKVNAEDYLAEV